jgi:hypothetical protein
MCPACQISEGGAGSGGNYRLWLQQQRRHLRTIDLLSVGAAADFASTASKLWNEPDTDRKGFLVEGRRHAEAQQRGWRWQG